MNKERKTTKEEHLEIVQYYLEHETNYRETSERYKVSYQEVYSWVKKYKGLGEQELVDRQRKAKEKSTHGHRSSAYQELKAKKANEDLELENLLIKN